MRSAPLETQTLFAALIGERRFIYHIMTQEKFAAAVAEGELVARSRLNRLRNDYAMGDLIQLRARIWLDAATMVPDTVPFYLTPRQPMFCRLVREGRVRADELVALGFDFDELHPRYDHWLFTSNPAYDGATKLGTWEAKGWLPWDVLMRWWWNSDDEPKEDKLRQSFLRQAELLVRGPVSLADLDHVVVHSSAAARSISALDQKRVVQIAGVFDW